MLLKRTTIMRLISPLFLALNTGPVALTVFALSIEWLKNGLVDAAQDEVITQSARPAPDRGSPRRHSPTPRGATVMGYYVTAFSDF